LTLAAAFARFRAIPLCGTPFAFREIYRRDTAASTDRRRKNSVTQVLDLIGTDEVESGAGVKVEKEGLILAVFRVADEFYVTDDTCTHGPGSLSEGFLDGYEIECDFHQGCFDIRTGEVTEPPCTLPLKVYTTIVRDGRVMIEL
jgi:nitrite reductase/ring-hydroxylating ferredoxin subunit